ncbi:mechanosensitive ion channel family protein, partial [Patescibacteria group bacterium]
MEEFLQTFNIELVWFWRGLWIVITWLVVFLAVRYIGRVMERLIVRAKHLDVAPRYLKQVDKLLDILMIITGVVITLLILGLHQIVLGVLTTAGITSLVIGIASRSMFENIFAGINLLFERPFDLGDKVEISLGYKQNYSGKIHKMSIMATQIMTDQGPIVTIPNSELTKTPIVNKTIHDEEPLEVSVAIANDNDVDTALDVLRDIFENDPRILKTFEPEFLVKDIREYAVDINAKAQVKKE